MWLIAVWVIFCSRHSARPKLVYFSLFKLFCSVFHSRALWIIWCALFVVHINSSAGELKELPRSNCLLSSFWHDLRKVFLMSCARQREWSENLNITSASRQVKINKRLSSHFEKSHSLIFTIKQPRFRLKFTTLHLPLLVEFRFGFEKRGELDRHNNTSNYTFCCMLDVSAPIPLPRSALPQLTASTSRMLLITKGC